MSQNIQDIPREDICDTPKEISRKMLKESKKQKELDIQKQITEDKKYIPSEITIYNLKTNNSNWCNLCVVNEFMHEKSLGKFIDKCIKIYDKSPKLFFTSRYSHILGLIIVHIRLAREILSFKKISLYDRYFNDQSMHTTSEESLCFVIDGLIRQHNINMYHKTKKEKDFESWLIETNEQCHECKLYFCPFHHMYGSFEHYNDNGVMKYLCGWCFAQTTDTTQYSDISETVQICIPPETLCIPPETLCIPPEKICIQQEKIFIL